MRGNSRDTVMSVLNKTISSKLDHNSVMINTTHMTSTQYLNVSQGRKYDIAVTGFISGIDIYISHSDLNSDTL